MELQANLGLSLMFTESNGEAARIALERAFTLAEELGDLPNQLRVLGRLHLFHFWTGNFHTALTLAQEGDVIAQQIGDAPSLAVAHSLLGISCHLVTDLETAHEHLETARAAFSASARINTAYPGVDHQNRTGIFIARTLWQLGFPERAATFARNSVDEATSLGHPISLCIALTWAGTVALWDRDWETAETYIDRLVAHARSRSILPFPAAGSGLQGYLAIKRGHAKTGVDLIQSSLGSLQRHRYELLTTILQGALAEGLSTLGQHDRAIKAIENALSFAERTGESFNLPELLRIKGDIMRSGPRPDLAGAEACYVRSLDLASRQSALSWELRTAISLARLWSGHGRAEDALHTLDALCDRFTEGPDRPDFLDARGLIDSCSGLHEGNPPNPVPASRVLEILS
jgi:tetratricopeptide (TPR) repeat protein